MKMGNKDRKYTLKSEWSSIFLKCLEDYLGELEQQNRDANYDYNKSYAERLINQIKHANAADEKFDLTNDQVGFVLKEAMHKFYSLDAQANSKVQEIISDMRCFQKG